MRVNGFSFSIGLEMGPVVTLQTQGRLSALMIMPLGIFAGYFIAKKLAMFS